jgi:hypothetical protein
MRKGVEAQRNQFAREQAVSKSKVMPETITNGS